MTFTDDDLKRLKEYGPDFKYTYAMIEALLARLEAAEKCINGCDASCLSDQELPCNCGGLDALKAWRKAAGK